MRGAVESEIGAPIDDAIKVVPLHCREPRIEILGNFLGDETATDAGRRCALKASRTVSARQSFRKIDMAYLSNRVHAGVGAPGAAYSHPLAAKAFACRGQHSLHARSVVLDLPADEGPAVVFYRQLIAGHEAAQLIQTPGRTGLPRRKSCAFIAARPARCNWRMRIEPSRQAMVRSLSITVPGAPEPSPLVERNTLMRAKDPCPPLPAIRTRRRETATIHECDCARPAKAAPSR